MVPAEILTSEMDHIWKGAHPKSWLFCVLQGWQSLLFGDGGFLLKQPYFIKKLSFVYCQSLGILNLSMVPCLYLGIGQDQAFPVGYASTLTFYRRESRDQVNLPWPGIRERAGPVPQTVPYPTVYILTKDCLSQIPRVVVYLLHICHHPQEEVPEWQLEDQRGPVHPGGGASPGEVQGLDRSGGRGWWPNNFGF